MNLRATLQMERPAISHHIQITMRIRSACAFNSHNPHRSGIMRDSIRKVHRCNVQLGVAAMVKHEAKDKSGAETTNGRQPPTARKNASKHVAKEAEIMECRPLLQSLFCSYRGQPSVRNSTPTAPAERASPAASISNGQHGGSSCKDMLIHEVCMRRLQLPVKGLATTFTYRPSVDSAAGRRRMQAPGKTDQDYLMPPCLQPNIHTHTHTWFVRLHQERHRRLEALAQPRT